MISTPNYELASSVIRKSQNPTVECRGLAGQRCTPGHKMGSNRREITGTSAPVFGAQGVPTGAPGLRSALIHCGIVAGFELIGLILFDLDTRRAPPHQTCRLSRSDGKIYVSSDLI
ncbi:hypothetical protein [Streptomyces plumbiresistens]